jgi:CubicO group peptidase (beta-lactamase class C family)
VLLILSVIPAQVLGQDWRSPEGLDAYIAEAREAWDVPGLAVAVVHDGKVVLAEGYGVRRLGDPEPVDEHTLFAIASNSKAFTAAALAILVDEGGLSWDDRVQDHLPWFQVYDPWVSHEMRIRDLLSHRSGLGTFSGDLLWYGTPYSAEEVIRRARHVPQAGPFRASYGYSNLMFIAAGLVIEEVSGQRWAEFIQDRFLTPLGMQRTVTSVEDLARTGNVAQPHGDRGGALRPFAWYNWDAMAAAGGIISSVSDMSRWLQLQLNLGSLEGRTYFTPDRSSDMWTVHNPFRVRAPSAETPASTHFRGYGLGWSLMDYRGRLVTSHGGGYDGMFSRVVLVPEEGLGIVVLTNSMTGISGAVTNRVMDAFLGGEERDWSAEGLEAAGRSTSPEERGWRTWEESRVEGTSPGLPLEGYVGRYGGPMYGDATVALEDGGLVLRLLPNADLVGDLTHWHHDTFRVTWRTDFSWFGDGLAQFVLDKDGQVEEILLDVPNGDFWFTELELTRREADGGM